MNATYLYIHIRPSLVFLSADIVTKVIGKRLVC